MTRDDIIRMAREAIETPHDGAHTNVWPFLDSGLERFAALVAAAERERLDLNAIHSCHAECQNPFCVRVREAVAHEREACARACEETTASWTQHVYNEACMHCAAAIRARG